MNKKSILAAIIGILGPILARRGIVLPPEFAGAISALGVFVCGLVANGVKLNFQDWPTTVAGLVGGGATALAAFGLNLPPDVQAGIATVALTVIGGLSRWPKWLSRGSGDSTSGGNGPTTAPLIPPPGAAGTNAW